MIFSSTFKTACAVLACSLSVFSAPSIEAAQPTAAIANTKQIEKTSTIQVNDTVMTVSGRFSVGLLYGEINEIVYNPFTGRKLSHLEWQLEDTVLVGAGISVMPHEKLRFNADFWINVTDGSGTMDDYDWFIDGADWTDWSTHDDMDVENIWKLDVNGEMAFYSKPNLTLTGILGLKHEVYELTASGGDFVYSSGNGFRDRIGSFPDGLLGITYEQIYTAPYIGIGFQTGNQVVTLSGRLIGSPLVNLETTDTHHLRDLEFEDDFETGFMFGIDIALTYHYSENLQFMCGFNYIDYDEVKGSTEIKDLSTGEVTLVGGDAAGSDNSNGLFMASAIYTF